VSSVRGWYFKEFGQKKEPCVLPIRTATLSCTTSPPTPFAPTAADVLSTANRLWRRSHDTSRCAHRVPRTPLAWPGKEHPSSILATSTSTCTSTPRLRRPAPPTASRRHSFYPPGEAHVHIPDVRINRQAAIDSHASTPTCVPSVGAYWTAPHTPLPWWLPVHHARAPGQLTESHHRALPSTLLWPTSAPLPHYQPAPGRRGWMADRRTDDDWDWLWCGRAAAHDG
jgi:hypothetical protein